MQWIHTKERECRADDLLRMETDVVESLESFRARTAIEKIVAENGASYESYLLAGRLQYLAGGYRRAIGLYIKAMLLAPDDPEPLYGLKDCYVVTGATDAAARMVDAIRLTEERAFARCAPASAPGSKDWKKPPEIFQTLENQKAHCL